VSDDLPASAASNNLVARVLRATAAGPVSPALVMEVIFAADALSRGDLRRILIELGRAARRERCVPHGIHSRSVLASAGGW
jgi:hypothetical protein